MSDSLHSAGSARGEELLDGPDHLIDVYTPAYEETSGMEIRRLEPATRGVEATADA